MHMPQMDVFGMGIIRQDCSNESMLNWIEVNHELALRGRVYIFERAHWDDKTIDQYRGHFPLQQIFHVPTPSALLVESIRPVPGAFQAGPLTLEQEEDEFIKQMNRFQSW